MPPPFTDDIFGGTGSLGIVNPGSQNSPFGASTPLDQGASLGGFTPPPLFDDSKFAPSADLLKRQRTSDLSGDIKTPSKLALIGYGLLGGPAAVHGFYNRQTAKEAIPVEARLRAIGETALQEGDLDTANQVATGFGQLASKAPQYAKQAESYLNRVSKKREDLATNQSIRETASEFIGDDPVGQQKLGALSTRMGKLSPTEFYKYTEKLFPTITEHEGYISIKNDITGKFEQKATKGLLTVKDLSPLEREAFTNLGIDPGTQSKYIEAVNNLNLGKGTLEHANLYAQITPALAQAGQQASRLKAFPPSSPAVLQTNPEYGPGGNVAAITGIGGQSPPPQPGGVGGPGIGQQSVPTGQAPSQVPPTGGLQQTPGTPPPGRLPLPGANLPGRVGVAPQGPPGRVPVPVQPRASVSNPEGAVIDPGANQRFVEAVRGDLGPQRPGESASEAANRRSRANETLKRLGESSATEVAKSEFEPPNKDTTAFAYTPEGPREIRIGGMSQSQLKNSGLYLATDANEIRYLRDFKTNIAPGEKLFERLKDPKQQQLLDSISSKVNRYVAQTGAQLPIDTPIGKIRIGFKSAGVPALSTAEADLYNRLVGFGQSLEKIINPSGNANENVGRLKDALTSSLSNSATVRNVIGSTLEQAHEQVQGRLSTAATSSNIPPKAFNDPNAPSQGGVAQNAQKSVGELQENLKKFDDFLQSKIPDSVKALGKKAVDNAVESIKRAPAELQNLYQQFIAGKPKPTPRTPAPNNTSGPINRDTERKLGTFR